MKNIKNRCIALYGAAMYLEEPPLILELMDLAFEINDDEINIDRIIEIENYIASKVSSKIDKKELERIILKGGVN